MKNNEPKNPAKIIIDNPALEGIETKGGIVQGEDGDWWLTMPPE